MSSWDTSFGNGNISLHNFQFQQLLNEGETLEKAFTTGSGVVTPGTEGGAALRTQFLPRKLQQVSFDQDDARLMKIIPKKRVGSNTIEWTDQLSYGSNGDGFVDEAGADGMFGVNGADDNFVRQVQKVKYLSTMRTVSLVSTLVDSVQKPITVSENSATLELVAKINTNCYDADESLSVNQFNGLKAQITQWASDRPDDADILFDMGGQPMNKDAFETLMELSHVKYGRASLFMSGIETYGDVMRSLYPESRIGEGVLGTMGVDKSKFLSTQGELKLDKDVMLKRNHPLVMDGPGMNGKPRSTVSMTPGNLPFAANPWASAPAAVAAGVARFWKNRNVVTDSATLGTAPEVPSSGYGGNNKNRLDIGSYYYAVASVYQGKESAVWVYGASAAGTVVGATAVTITGNNPIVQLDLDTSTPAIAGLGSTFRKNLVKFRVYRFGGPGSSGSAPTNLSDFDHLFDIGTPQGGNARGYDNGMYIPGSGDGYLITEKKNGADGWFLAQLLPLLKRPLPQMAMADLFAMLAFVTPILWVPRHHIWVRNIGRLG